MKMDEVKFECVIISNLHLIDPIILWKINFSQNSGMSFSRLYTNVYSTDMHVMNKVM